MVYVPREDSFLIKEQVEKFCKDKKVLDMGTGSGILAISALENGAKLVVAVDKDQNTITNLRKKKLKIKVIKSNLFSKVEGLFDLIIFNPPYLPKDSDNPKDLDLCGGVNGNELSIKFLMKAKKYLEKKGFILMIISSISNPFETLNQATILGYSNKTLSEKRLNFETLYCTKFWL